MSTDLESSKRRVLEMLRNRDLSGKAKPKALTDDQIFSAIIGKEATVTNDDLQTLHDSTESTDFDEWIFLALRDRGSGRCQLDSAGKMIEHPTARVFRLGIESIEAGKASTLFLTLLKEIAKRADSCEADVLNLLFPREFPTIDYVQLSTALKKERIVRDFRKESEAARGRMSYKEFKARFKREQQLKGRVATAESVDRTLTEFGLDFKAKPGPTKKPRTKPDAPTIWESWDSVD